MLKVFEAFSGYGSQRMALKNLGIDHEIVGISEIDGDAILSYSAIHNNLNKFIKNDVTKTEEEMKKYLEKINVPLDYKTFQNKASKLKGEKLKKIYLANKLSRNYGDIKKIKPDNLPDFDFFTYSFPCQDISIAGYQSGLNENSNSRSSLLWECLKIIKYKKPRILMMENVKNLIGKNHKKNFDTFLQSLSSLGYKNHWCVLNARDFNVPQNRERVFCISILDNSYTFEFPKPYELTLKVTDLLEKEVDNKFILKNNQVTEEPIFQKYIYCLDSNYWKGTSLTDFLKKKRRQLVSCSKNKDGEYPVRRLTPLETWRFMGCSDKDFTKAQEFVSNTNLYKQSGNSIVVPVLEAIFKNLFCNHLNGKKI
ncbi:DNA cytosine methyltransferase [Staphylococcus xylosus]|uniref:DNA cytosine methyltransferase n=1 Tax=Staphylococcus xylosus TaxID=1288 RepID=UPI003F5641C8